MRVRHDVEFQLNLIGTFVVCDDSPSLKGDATQELKLLISNKTATVAAVGLNDGSVMIQ